MKELERVIEKVIISMSVLESEIEAKKMVTVIPENLAHALATSPEVLQAFLERVEIDIKAFEEIVQNIYDEDECPYSDKRKILEALANAKGILKVKGDEHGT